MRLRSVSSPLCQAYWIAWFILLFTVTVQAQPKAPFVSGFERFGRHGEVNESLVGEVLISELSCTACHASKTVNAKGGPQLRSLARRVTRQWLGDYLDDPSNMKPGTTMPDVLVNLPVQQRSETIEALVAFLSTRQAKFPEIKAGGMNPVELEYWTKGNRMRGIDLYHETGCVACHGPDPEYEVTEIPLSPLDALLDDLDMEELEEMGLAGAARRVESVPHGVLIRKYSRRSLTRFLYDPVHFRPSGRMPKMKLMLSEAADIAEYLLHKSELDDHIMTPSRDAGLVERGKRFFQTLGCANCHDAGVDPVVESVPLNQLVGKTSSLSCLNENTDPPVDYSLDDEQINAIEHVIGSPNAAQRIDNLSDSNFVQTTLLKMNCFGCHEREGLGGVGRYRKGYFETVTAVDLGDEGRLPPPLTGVGRKLKESWMKKVVRGEKGTTLRSHMTIRMPTFPHADVLEMVSEIGKVDGADTTSADEVFGPYDDTAQSGQGLMEIGCIQCHVFDGQAMPGVIGIDLTGVPERVHPSWFRDFITNPGGIKKRTRMPTFFPDGKSQVPDVLDGQADRQIAAMWRYLANHETIGIPTKIAIERRKDYELKPSGRPLILRTFVNGVGTHAIAVGFPEGTHFAFDADRCRLAVGWRESFLDARSTWFERLSPPIAPLGSEAQVFLDVDGFYELDGDEKPETPIPLRFLGYRLDKNRVPTFRYQCDDHLIEDRITPDESGGLQRSIRSTPLDQPSELRDETQSPIWFSIGPRRSDAGEIPKSIKLENGLTIQLQDTGSIQANSQLDDPRWMAPLINGQAVKVNYQW